MSVRRVLRQARALTFSEVRLLISACAAHALVRLLVVLLPLPRVAALTARSHSRRLPPVSGERLAQLVRWSTALCGGTCLTEGLVLRALAARRGLDVPLIIGIRREGDRLRAHAWTGGETVPGFVPLWRSASARREAK